MPLPHFFALITQKEEAGDKVHKHHVANISDSSVSELKGVKCDKNKKPTKRPKLSNTRVYCSIHDQIYISVPLYGHTSTSTSTSTHSVFTLLLFQLPENVLAKLFVEQSVQLGRDVEKRNNISHILAYSKEMMYIYIYIQCIIQQPYSCCCVCLVGAWSSGSYLLEDVIPGAASVTQQDLC